MYIRTNVADNIILVHFHSVDRVVVIETNVLTHITNTAQSTTADTSLVLKYTHNTCCRRVSPTRR